jgi:hypothetical protein
MPPTWQPKMRSKMRMACELLMNDPALDNRQVELLVRRRYGSGLTWAELELARGWSEHPNLRAEREEMQAAKETAPPPAPAPPALQEGPGKTPLDGNIKVLLMPPPSHLEKLLREMVGEMKRTGCKRLLMTDDGRVEIERTEVFHV